MHSAHNAFRAARHLLCRAVMLQSFALAQIFLFAAAAAAPDSPRERPENAPFAWLETAAAVDAPAGNWSLGLSLNLHSHVALAASGGEDLSGHHLRAALAVRFKLLNRGRTVLDAGPVLSYMDGDERGSEGRWSDGYRLGAEVGVTYRISRRLTIRGFAGVGMFLNRRCCNWYPPEPEPPRQWADHPVVPHAGLSFNIGLASSTEAVRAPRASSHSWYGMQLLAVDVATVALWFAAPSRDLRIYPWIAGTAAAPVVHSLAGHPGRGAISVLLRVALPVIGGLAGMALTSDEYNDDPFEGAAEGAVAGWLTAVLFDDVWLARGVPESPPAAILPVSATGPGGR